MTDTFWDDDLPPPALDPANPCPKCGSVPLAPADGFGRMCTGCTWTWDLKHPDEGRYLQDPVSDMPAAPFGAVIDARPLEEGSLGFGMPDPPNDWYRVISDIVDWHERLRDDVQQTPLAMDDVAAHERLRDQLRNYVS